MELTDVADRVAALGVDVADGAARLRTVQPSGQAFVGDGPGALFTAGAALHAQWQAGLAARERELVSQSTELTALAAALRRAADTYDEAEQRSHQTHLRDAR